MIAARWRMAGVVAGVVAPISTALLALVASSAFAQEPPRACTVARATTLLSRGMEQQRDGNSNDALASYHACIAVDAACTDCWYEMGWSYWKLGEWKHVITSWEQALLMQPRHPDIPQYLPSAKQNLEAIEKKLFTHDLRRNVELLIGSEPAEAPVQMTFVGRWQSYNRNVTHPLDRFDEDIDSPKSVNFSPDGKLIFVNSLESAKTIVYDSEGTRKRAVIEHRFTPDDTALFQAKPPFDYSFPKGNKLPNVFSGKPVEGEFTHGGRYFWASHYRRSYDELGRWPSALAIIDSSTLKIVRVLAAGTIAKFVRASVDGKWLAVSHWGDNTVGLFDISADDVAQFKEAELLTVEQRVPVAQMSGNRDLNCGFCVRGLAFTPDSRHLVVGRMQGGGIAVFDLSTRPRRYLGTIDGLAPGPRDLHIDKRGEFLYVSCNATGFIWKVPMRRLLELAHQAKGQRVKVQADAIGAIAGFAGLGVRSIKISPNDDYVFAAVNQTSEIVALRASDMTIVSRIGVDSYPVGLDLSPDGTQLWVTAQGRKALGGNSVGAFQVRYKQNEVIFRTKGPVGVRVE